MKVAIVRNRYNSGIVSKLGQQCPETYGRRSVQNIINALRSCGHTVALFEGDKQLISNLEKFMSPDPESGLASGIVFNMSYGIQGESRYTHVPGMLEMSGIPYTGSSPLGHALALDKVIAKRLMREAGVPTPNFLVMSDPDENIDGLKFPLIVKPRHESTSYGLRLVQNRKQLKKAVLVVLKNYQQDALVEEYISGREACVGLLGNDSIEFLPIVELDFNGRELHTLTWEDKYHKSSDEPEKLCPADFSEELANRLRKLSLDTFRACHCKDFARVDIRIDKSGMPFVLEINSMASLGTGGAFVLAAKNTGYSFKSLISRIIDITHERYFGVSESKYTPSVGRKSVNQPQMKLAPSSLKSEETNFLEPELVNKQEFAPSVSIAKGERGLLHDRFLRNNTIPFQLTRFYEDQIRRHSSYDQIKQIIVPSEQEFQSPGQLDTSGEYDNTKVNGLQHKYPQTALLLVTEECFSYCRFCFRKRLVGQASLEIARDYTEIAEYIKGHPEINNVLLSGGDPFALSTNQLNEIVDHLLEIPHLSSIRFGTKALVYYPIRFHDYRLKEMFKKIKTAGKTPVIVTHVDHIGEVSGETEVCIKKLRKLGVQFFNQAVLLKKVNDNSEVLAATFEKLHSMGVRPYYLFQARPVQGASHFQVPLKRGVEIVHDVNRRLSGIQKTFRYIMSHYTGKIEILDFSQDNLLYMRYHQNSDEQKIGIVFSRPCHEEACWFDDLSSLSTNYSELVLCETLN